MVIVSSDCLGRRLGPKFLSEGTVDSMVIWFYSIILNVLEIRQENISLVILICFLDFICAGACKRSV